MSKHTLGPWTARGAKDGSGDIGIKAPSKRNIIAECFADMDFDGENAREECAANACLIAAAPELLEALKTIRAYTTTSQVMLESEIVRIVDAAISKAEAAT